MYNSKETTELLISLGANINEKDNYGKTALHYAAENNGKETAELLISHGININEKGNYGETEYIRISAVSLLLFSVAI